MNYIYATAANGMRVRIPEDRFEQWQKAQEEIRAGRKPSLPLTGASMRAKGKRRQK